MLQISLLYKISRLFSRSNRGLGSQGVEACRIIGPIFGDVSQRTANALSRIIKGFSNGAPIPKIHHHQTVIFLLCEGAGEIKLCCEFFIFLISYILS